MDKQAIIDRIKEHKKQPNLRYQLKERVEAFTDRLFYTLFDIDTPVETNLAELEATFSVLADLACWEVERPCKKVWENYVVKLPQVLESLNLDAEAIVDCDPASLSIEEVYMAYPGFYAIAIYRLAHELYDMGLPFGPKVDDRVCPQTNRGRYQSRGPDRKIVLYRPCHRRGDRGDGDHQEQCKDLSRGDLRGLVRGEEVAKDKAAPHYRKQCDHLCQCHHFRREYDHWGEQYYWRKRMDHRIGAPQLHGVPYSRNQN